MSKSYTIDRKTASRLLSVALRTIDRYLSTGRLSHTKISGRVWLNKEEILDLYKELQTDRVDTLTDTLWQADNVDRETDTEVVTETIKIDNTAKDKEKRETDTEVYKGLYLETKEKLDQATFRIGQLESQLSSMVPLLEYQRQQKMLQESTETYQKKIKETESSLLLHIESSEKKLKQKDKEIEDERFNKAVIAVILFFILFLQPILWILLK